LFHFFACSTYFLLLYSSQQRKKKMVLGEIWGSCKSGSNPVYMRVAPPLYTPSSGGAWQLFGGNFALFLTLFEFLGEMKSASSPVFMRLTAISPKNKNPFLGEILAFLAKK
jgi:hypothetical protein